MNRKGFVPVIAAVFIGLFALVSGYVAAHYCDDDKAAVAVDPCVKCKTK